MIFCGGINEYGERKSKKKIKIYLLTKYTNSVLLGVLVRLSYI